MARQIVVIHGGDAFNTYEEYLNDLKAKKLSLDRIRYVDWKGRLHQTLGPEYDVLRPQMPNKQNARYVEWKIIFEKLVPLLDDTVVLIGHSLGGIFLAKYLAENTYPKKIRATFLVAAPFNEPIHNPYVDFNLEGSLDGFASQAGDLFIYHSKDDPVVPYESAAAYMNALPGATLRPFNDRQHFNQSDFPEIVADIRSLS